MDGIAEIEHNLAEQKDVSMPTKNTYRLPALCLAAYAANLVGPGTGISFFPQAIADAPAVTTDVRDAVAIDQSDWRQAAFADLWKSTCARSPDIQFILSTPAFANNEEAKAIIAQWLFDLCKLRPQTVHRPEPEVFTQADLKAACAP